ncbi:hypothetical protein DHD32_14465 [Arenibacter sp. TNZ]|nr:hypothetical protein [Arenibacter sp. TNZ]
MYKRQNRHNPKSNFLIPLEMVIEYICNKLVIDSLNQSLFNTQLTKGLELFFYPKIGFSACM